MHRWWTRDRLALAAAILGPLTLAALLAPLRTEIANTDAALILVLVVVAVAANGYRVAGILAALSAAVWFDFFLTAPYDTFAISKRADIETTVLLMLVGIAVTELAVWGRRQHVEASRRAGYLAGVQAAAEAVASGTSPAAVIDQVCEQLTRVLGLRRCRFDYGSGVVGGDRPRLRPDGQVTYRGAVCDVDRDGLPTDADIELLLSGGGTYRGRFLLTAQPASRPTLAQRVIALALADRAEATLAQHHANHA